MYSFLLDAWAAIRLRFFAPEHYRYNAAVTTGILLVTGAVNAAGMAPLFGGGNGAVAFAFCLTILKWLSLSFSMSLILGYYSRQKINWRGYFLLISALGIPQLADIYFPQQLFIPLSIWSTWIIVVQVFGLMKLSGQNIFKVILGFLVSGMIFLISAQLLGSVFIGLGWLDQNEIMKHVQAIVNAAQTGK